MLTTSILFNFITKTWATRVGDRERERERDCTYQSICLNSSIKNINPLDS